MSTHRNLARAIGFLGMAALAPSLSFGQTAPPPIDQKFNLQLFQPAVGPYSFLTIESADVPYHKQFALGFWLDYQQRPLALSLRNYHGFEYTDAMVPLVSRMMTGTLTGAVGFRDRYQFGVAVPVSYVAGELDPSGNGPSYYGIGLGDPRFDAKARLTTFGEDDELVLAVAGGFSLPVSTLFAKNDPYQACAAGATDCPQMGKLWLGDKLPTVNARGLAEYHTGDWRFGASLGVLVRSPQQIRSATTGSQLTWGLAAGWQVTDKTELLGEIHGRSGLISDWQYADANPYEADAAIRMALPRMAFLTVGAGMGMPVRDMWPVPWTSGMGAPVWRAFAALQWVPDYRDADRDGVYDVNDQCRDQPEDRDGYKDDDGCPDPDNDGDAIEDVDDKCPNDAEDFDQFQDEDGCPDLDNDKDGIPDIKDACPSVAEDGRGKRPNDGCPSTQEDEDGDGIPDVKDKCKEDPEDKDGFEDDDGCPDVDNDNDGLPDNFDTCPNEAEDFDNFEDDDGCPEPDNDKDGVPDTADKCPNQPETLNGNKDEDGCPDAGPELLKLTENKIQLSARLYFEKDAQGKTALKEPSKILVKAVAMVLRGHPEIRKLRIEVRAEGVQPAETQRRADAVRDFLVASGIDTARLVPVGAGAGTRTELIIESTAASAKKAAAASPTPMAAPLPEGNAEQAPADPAGAETPSAGTAE